jgi:hypothetical protein
MKGNQMKQDGKRRNESRKKEERGRRKKKIYEFGG